MSEQKDTNPKDLVAGNKIPFHVWPTTATFLGALGMLEGMLKYGRLNFRDKGIRVSVYTDALERHINAYKAGEDIDPESGLPHLAKILSCAAVLADASVLGNITDDREYKGGGYLALVDAWTPAVAALKAKYADKDPKHYTIADNAPVLADSDFAELLEDSDYQAEDFSGAAPWEAYDNVSEFPSKA
jgi:hypothetical protein